MGLKYRASGSEGAKYTACKNLGFGPFGTVGTAIGLTGWKLFVAAILNVLWGALMDIGFGLYEYSSALKAPVR